ncbi:MAG: EpsI family protein [Bryobacteraceae bacterium]|nr:EpsI family protein [Bryobacteraceae bacterium]
MPVNFDSFRKPKALILTIVLLSQAALVYGFRRSETIPSHVALHDLSRTFGTWNMVQETTIDKETLDVLKADDTLNRSYMNGANGAGANLFVAFFKSQRTGQTPHSPKNCLPGSGWIPSVSDHVMVDVEGRPAMEVNRYVVQKGDHQSLVLYWYQSRDRIVASEYEAKFWVVADALRYNRTDTALVRVVVAIRPGETVDTAMNTATGFVRAFYSPLRHHFPA